MIFRKLTKKELKVDHRSKVQVGEFFASPLVVYTPRNNFIPEDETDRYNDQVQVTIIGNNIQTRVNGTTRHGPGAFLFDHLVEGLCPTNLVMSQKIGEYLVRMTGPVAAQESTIMENRFEYRMENRRSITYDYSRVGNYCKERMMKMREIFTSERFVNEPTGNPQGSTEMAIIRTIKRKEIRRTVNTPIFASTSMSTNISTGGEYLSRSSMVLMSTMTQRIVLAIKKKEQLFSRFMTTANIAGTYYMNKTKIQNNQAESYSKI